MPGERDGGPLAPAVADSKVTAYLLERPPRRRRPQGPLLPRYFIACGFSPDEPAPFIEALLEHGEAGHLTGTTRGPFGIKYVCEGPLRAPRGVIRRVRSVWQQKPGDVWRFLVTAYPF